GSIWASGSRRRAFAGLRARGRRSKLSADLLRLFGSDQRHRGERISAQIGLARVFVCGYDSLMGSVNFLQPSELRADSLRARAAFLLGLFFECVAFSPRLEVGRGSQGP